MPKGDWNENTTIRPGRIEAVWDDTTNQFAHIGIGYEVVGPSGVVLSSRGWTWHNPAEEQEMRKAGLKMVGEEHRGSQDAADQIKEALMQVVTDLLKMEGCNITPPRKWTVNQGITQQQSG